MYHEKDIHFTDTLILDTALEVHNDESIQNAG